MSIADYYHKLEAEGRLEEAFTLLVEQGIPDSNQAAELLNKISIAKLHEDDLKAAHYFLKKAQELSCTSKIKAITYNNLACYYRRLTKFRISLSYLEKALCLDNSADTRLNMCAVLSHSGKHSQALEQALHALVLIQEQIIEENDPGAKAPVLAVGFHNLAVELEYLNRLPESHSYYTKAVICVKKYCDPRQPVYMSIIQAYESFISQQGITHQKLTKEKSVKRTIKTAVSSITRNTPIANRSKRIIFKENNQHRKTAQGVLKAALESSTAKLWGSVQNMPKKSSNKKTAMSVPKNIDKNSVGLNIQTENRVKTSEESYDSEIEMRYDARRDMDKQQDTLPMDQSLFSIRNQQISNQTNTKRIENTDSTGNLLNFQTKLSSISLKSSESIPVQKFVTKGSMLDSDKDLNEEIKYSSIEHIDSQDEHILSNSEIPYKESMQSGIYASSLLEMHSNNIESDCHSDSSKSSSTPKGKNLSFDNLEIPEDNSPSSDESVPKSANKSSSSISSSVSSRSSVSSKL